MTTILDTPILARIRRNHALEHATIHILSGTFPYRSIAGYSFPGGFFLFGDIPTDHVRKAAVQALARMNNGERHLAIHPGCGTNYVVSGVLAGGLAWLGMATAKNKRQMSARLPLAILLATLGFIASQPLGPMVQERLTTSADVHGLTILDIFPVRYGRFSVHRVITRS